ncbi:MAG: 50S ribosomal protein L13 [Candidatus Nealsonbacteria bacterium RBG_13_37_56]|uniref:Large ribosomal subunit protein uL13 n=1 Tax=Candidatus Nealsonbacteria bacterium RBG_13_37_56 TaxID=1801661 RepID=A0A1G2DV25_9BACT|nr:MAG: 50S ribosomal protein L13 [Candidatus Nealsonbacteria bacterium RBG_13_37_56]
MKREIHTIDATNKVLGRLAVEIAYLLRGKGKTDFAPNKDMGDLVIIKNADKIIVTGKKFDEKIYYHHSGYLGGLKETPFKKIFKENPGEVIRRAVFGMLPKNKLRAKQIIRLKFE